MSDEILLLEDELGWDDQLDKWENLIAFWRFFPDLFLDAITPVDPDTGKSKGIRLGCDQRMFLRSLSRMPWGYYIFSRGYGKTLLELLSVFIAAVLTPDLEISMSAQTLQASAGLFADKINEIKKYYPILAEEIVKEEISKDRVVIKFKSGSVVTNLQNDQTAKGKRRHIILLEESALLKEKMYRDALMPLTNYEYKSLHNLELDCYVINRQHFVTTAYYKNDAYDKYMKMAEDMINLKGAIVMGASWELPERFGRGQTKDEIMAIKEYIGNFAFAVNYESKWVGVNENCIVDIGKFESLRSLVKAELKHDGKSSYYMGVDVARSSKSSNNQTSIMIGKVRRDKKGKIQKVQIVYTANLPQGLNFKQQSLYIKKLKKMFDVQMVVIDANGLGIGLCDYLLETTIDPITGEEFPAFDTINMDIESEEQDSERCLYGLKAQGINSDIIVNFMNYVDTGKLQLLEKVDSNLFDSSLDLFQNKVLPHIQTDFLVEEVGNVSVETLPNGKLTMKQNTKNIDKDRVSSLMYLLYYLEKYENNIQQEKSDVSGYLIYRSPVIRR